VTTYSANVHREGDWWVIEVDGIGATQAKRLDQVDHMARDLIALMKDVPADSVQIAATVRLAPELELARQTHERLRREADAAAQMASGAREQLMRGLQAAHLSARDIAELTGVSHQRVSQLVGAAKDAGRAAAWAVAVRRAPATSSGNSRVKSATTGRYVVAKGNTVKDHKPTAAKPAKVAKVAKNAGK
jgi:hypothetical protein